MTAVRSPSEKTRSAGSQRKLLVIYKKSAYQIYVKERRNAQVTRLVEQQDPLVRSLYEAHQCHVDSLEKAKAIFRKMQVQAVFRYRSESANAADADLVVTLGGDGTLLGASRLVGSDKPVLAINTVPRESVGHFCAGDVAQLEQLARAALAGRLRETRLTRMRVELDGRTISTRVLNDVLFCHASPAATSRYLLRLAGREEEHKSSGVWVGPASGSTAAMASAGGKKMAAGSKRLQFVVREPYVRPGGSNLSLTQGFVEAGEYLELVSKVRNARLFIDGPRQKERAEIGSIIRLARSDEPMWLLGYRWGAGRG